MREVRHERHESRAAAPRCPGRQFRSSPVAAGAGHQADCSGIVLVPGRIQGRNRFSCDLSLQDQDGGDVLKHLFRETDVRQNDATTGTAGRLEDVRGLQSGKSDSQVSSEIGEIYSAQVSVQYSGIVVT